MDVSTQKGKIEYYNSKGENSVMTCSLTAQNFKIVAYKIKFEGNFNNDDTELTGKWSLEKENGRCD